MAWLDDSWFPRRSGEVNEVIKKAVAELDDAHFPQWSTREGYTTINPRNGKEPVGCAFCYPQDGDWPCVTRMIADDLRRACAN